jgi:hypothetical protein
MSVRPVEAQNMTRSLGLGATPRSLGPFQCEELRSKVVPITKDKPEHGAWISSKGPGHSSLRLCLRCAAGFIGYSGDIGR